MSAVRAAVVRVAYSHRSHGRIKGFDVWFRILKRGRKPLRIMLVLEQDEIGAFLKAQKILRERGYKV